MSEFSYTDMSWSHRKSLVYLLDDFPKMGSADKIRKQLILIRNSYNSTIIDNLLNSPDELLASRCIEATNTLKASL